MCKITIILLSFALMAGCSSKHARIQDVSITTDPTGIRATIGDQACMTPCTLTNVDRTAEYVMFEQGAYRQQYALDKKNHSGAMTTVEFIGLKIGIPAVVITGAAYEIQPIEVKFSGLPGNPLKTATPVGAANGLREVAVEPDILSEQVSSVESEARPFALITGVSYNLYDYGMRTVTGLLRFEKGIGRRLSWYLDIGYADYRSTQDDYRDTAHGRGGEAGMNIYSSSRALEGLYFGVGLGFWNFQGDWKDDAGTPFETTGRGSAGVVDFNVHVGCKWLLSEYQGFFIDPSIALDLMDSSGEPYAFGPAGGSWRGRLAIGKRW